MAGGLIAFPYTNVITCALKKIQKEVIQKLLKLIFRSLLDKKIPDWGYIFFTISYEYSSEISSPGNALIRRDCKCTFFIRNR